jgi:hypothetical protein
MELNAINGALAAVSTAFVGKITNSAGWHVNLKGVTVKTLV